MTPVNFEGSNVTLTKPSSMTDEECYSAPAYAGVDDAGHNYIVTAWMPNREDIDAINAGRPVFMKNVGGMFPTILYTTDENMEPNVEQ